MRHSPILGSMLLSMLFLTATATATNDAPSETAHTNMTWMQAAVLGAVEGFTEYLPVSSTGHLILTQRAMGIGQTEAEKTAADAYAIAIQAGAILAVLTLYFPYLRRMYQGLLGRDREGRQLAVNLLVAFLPAALIGLLFNDLIKAYLFNLWAIVFSWFVGGVAILAVNRYQRNKPERLGIPLEALKWKHALLIGLLQCVAMWPGTSRSLVTILGGLLAGLSLTSAVVFSFLLGVITLTAATAYDMLQHGSVMLDSFGLMNLFIGFAVATLAAIASVKWFLHYLRQHGLALFGYYRVALAIVVAALILSGVLVDQL
jgi:undecaprenyl-diphosphatase